MLTQSVLPTLFLQPDRPLPMVAARDIGTTAARLLLAPAATHRLIELNEPQDYSPEDAGQAFSNLMKGTAILSDASEACLPRGTA